MNCGHGLVTWVVVWATALTLVMSRELTPQLDAVYIEGKYEVS